MDPVEAVAAILVVVNVALVARRSVWNYPFAIVAVALYAVVFHAARLYSDMLLQGFFLVLNIYGWLNWSRNRAATGRVTVVLLSPAARLGWGIGCLVAIAVWGALMNGLTDASYPWWDAGVAIFSIAAQIMMARRQLENWILWIGVDIASIGLYASKELWPTAALYAILLGLAVWGLLHWQAAWLHQRRRGENMA